MTERKYPSYTLVIDGLAIEVTRKRVKNVNYRVDGAGRARMSVPWHMPRVRVEQYARMRIDWFRAHMERDNTEKTLSPVKWVTGERLRVWGEVVTLEVAQGEGVPSCICADNKLVVCVPAGSTAKGRHELVERWLRDELRERLVGLVPACEERVGVHAASIALRRMKSRWGSCTSGKKTIRLNTALAECPPECLEMVLVHELCHLLESNHGPRFHALMDLHCPSWRVWQRWLNEHPPRVV